MCENNIFWNIFSKRALISFFVMMMFFLSCILRVAVTAAGFDNELLKRNCYKLKIADLRGTIYDCNMIPITNNKEKIIAAVSPTNRAITAVSNLIDEEKREEILNILKNGEPVVCEIPEDIKCDGIVTTKIYETVGDLTPSNHLIGYTNSENKGVCGIEAAYNDLLYSNEKAIVYFESDGRGKILEGAKAIIENNSSITASGVVTTIDINIQNIAEKTAVNIEKGAIIIAEAKTGKIRAMVSRPYYDNKNIEIYLESEDSPLLNRAINVYNVGSVFKPCVAAAGIENQKTDFEYTCTGNFEIIDRIFKCHELKGHGLMNLNSALANSCNTYFYNYSQLVTGDKIYNMASSLSFGQRLKLCDGIYTSKGNLPQKDTLDNPATLANFSIGQGKLLLSPVSMLTLYCAIATDGGYYIPSVVEKTIKNGKVSPYDMGKKTRVFSEKTAETLRKYLLSVITEGTGLDAQPKFTTAAGKTATAQTGKFENSAEISQGWFCGFFPAEEPEYVVIIFSENTKKQIKTSNQIFSEIADNMTILNN